MAHRKRKRSGLGCGACAPGLGDPSFMRASVKVAGTAVVGKLILWGVALLALKLATKTRNTTVQRVTESVNKIASPPEFMARNIVPESVQRV